MKARWLKSVVKHSKRPAPALPYHRGVRPRVTRRSTMTQAKTANSA